MVDKLPDGWKEDKISVYCDIISGSTPKTNIKEYWGGNIPWITPKDLSGYKKKYIEKTNRTITKEGYDSCSTTLIPEYNVLMSSRAPIGYIVINKKPICTNQGFKSFKIKDKKELNESFLYYQLMHIVDKIKITGSGTTFNEISKTKASNIQIKVPPYILQQQIVDEIEKQFTRLEASVKDLKSVKDKLEVYRKSVLKSAFDDLKEITELNNLCYKITDGSHNPPKKSETGEYLMLSAKDVFNNKIFFNNTRSVNKKSFEIENKRTEIKQNDVLLTIVGSIGRSVVVTKDMPQFILQRSVAVLKPTTEINSTFLSYQLQNPTVQNELWKKSRGVAQKGIYLNNLKTISIKKCSLSEQQKIVQEIESHFSVIDKLQEVIESSLNKGEKLRKSILKSAFEGKLVKE